MLTTRMLELVSVRQLYNLSTLGFLRYKAERENPGSAHCGVGSSNRSQYDAQGRRPECVQGREEGAVPLNLGVALIYSVFSKDSAFILGLVRPMGVALC